MKQFAYVEPGSVSEAVYALSANRGKGWHALAGGTDVVVMVQQGKLKPEGLVNLGRVPELAGLEVDPKAGARIGAMTRIRDLERSRELNALFPIIGEALRWFGGITIRNMATVGGNLCRGNPSADLPPVFIVLSALFHIVGPRGERIIPAEEFFLRPGVTVLEEDELLTAVELPAPGPGARGAYYKQSPRAVDLATLGFAVWLELTAAGVCRDARLALAGAAPVPLRLLRAEQCLRGRSLDEEALTQAACAAAEDCRPRQDSVRAAPEYRRRLIRALLPRILERAVRGR